MPQYDVIILTESRYLNPPQLTPYINNVLLEDRLVQEAIERKGLKVGRMDWATPNFDWSCAKALLFRTIWDYFERWDEFDIWLKHIEKTVPTINAISTIKWNVDKHYLGDLRDKGINVPPFKIAHKGDEITLSQIFEENNFNEVVLKPTISGGAFETYRIHKNEIATYEKAFARLISERDMMVQSFQKNVLEKGEISLMLFNGQFSHSILKIAKPGDFRVQDDHGGTVHHYQATPEEIKFAQKAVAACSPLPTYARVDIFYDNNNQPSLVELELIEPELWFRFNEKAADKLASAVIGQLANL